MHWPLRSAMFLPGFLALAAVHAPAAAGEPESTRQPIQPFAVAGAPPAPWHVAGLPSQHKPFTRFEVVELDGRHALRVQADESYGNLVHPLHLDPASGHLAWEWRVDQLVDAADLRTRAGDDAALKVCVSFDLPLEQVPFFERQWLRAARAHASEPLPAATVCYVWDPHLPVGTQLDNAFTRRLRYIVLESGAPHPPAWVAERRDVAADFASLFGAESATVPPIVDVLVGADADNTHGHSLGFVAGLTLTP